MQILFFSFVCLHDWKSTTHNPKFFLSVGFCHFVFFVCSFNLMTVVFPEYLKINSWLLLNMCLIWCQSLSVCVWCSCCVCICVLDAVKINPNVNVKESEVKKEVVSKDDQLALDVKGLNMKEGVSKDGQTNGKRAQTFTFDELAIATGNFRSDCFLGEGGFGKVYKGRLEKINQVGLGINLILLILFCRINKTVMVN